MRALELFDKYGVEYNTLTAISASNSTYGEGKEVALPPGIDSVETMKPRNLSPFNVTGEAYGKFLCDVFDIWVKEDIGKKFIQIFEATIGNMTNRPAGLCVHEAVCGHCGVIEHNGDLYRCDRYVFDEYRIGNIARSNLGIMMESNRAFGQYKLESLPSRCLHCDVVELCFGGCPKDRLNDRLTLYGVERYNWLCSGYKIFFSYFKENFNKINI